MLTNIIRASLELGSSMVSVGSGLIVPPDPLPKAPSDSMALYIVRRFMRHHNLG